MRQIQLRMTEILDTALERIGSKLIEISAVVTILKDLSNAPLAGIVLTVGLYQLYRQEAATLSRVAAGLSLLGYLLFAIVSFAWNPENILVSLGDILIYVVGVPLFSWLAYTTQKLPRLLSMVGYLAGLAGLAGYILRFGAGVEPSNVNHPLAGVAGILYMIYFIAVLGWLIWTGISLLSSKTKTVMATA